MFYRLMPLQSFIQVLFASLFLAGLSWKQLARLLAGLIWGKLMQHEDEINLLEVEVLPAD